MGWLNRGNKNPATDKAARSTTPPGKVQKPKYGDKKMVKAKNPKTGKGKAS